MIDNEMKSIIGQNCSGYEAKYVLSILSMGSLAESCNNCINYEKGYCVKDLLEPMRKQLERN